MTSNVTESGVHLTTSRLNRLLRPLRNKCNSLATLPKTATSSRVTYSKQSFNWDPDSRLPLVVLYPSAGAKGLTVNKNSVGDFELSRRIYAVCDAFKNIIHVAFGQPCNDRIPSLAAMCALVVGENLPAATSGGITDEDPTDENDTLDMDGIYELVPPHYRRFSIASHVLSMILCTCTHHHTLVAILLDHCLSFGLIHESTRLLNIVLAQAFLPSSLAYPPPATHPAHTNYLLDLHAKWISGNDPSESSLGSSLFTTSAFCQAVLSTLSQSSSTNLYMLWTSKVLGRLLHAIENCDIDSYILFIRALSQSFREISGSSPDTIRNDPQLVALRNKLSELMLNLFDRLFAQQGSYSSSLTSSRVYVVIDILSDCHAARLHCLRVPTSGSPIDLVDMIATFATHIFVTLRSSISDSERLLAILDDSTPTPTTFSKLVVYFGRPKGSQAFGDLMEVFLSELERYSSALCSKKLFVLDASLWACALQYFQTSAAGSQKGSSTLVAEYKRQIMEAVDAAERRCFEKDLDNCFAVSLPVHPSCEWRWEDTVESWIQRTPAYKKRKVDDGRPHVLSRHNRPRPGDAATLKVASGSTSISAPLSTYPRHLSVFAPSSPSQHSESESPAEDGSEYQDEIDKENYPGNFFPVAKRSRPIKRRSTNFFSLLADAQTNRIVLHSKPRPVSRPSSSVILEKFVSPLSSQGSRHASCKQVQQASHRKAVPPAPSENLLPSDDSLNLFAYATSSPRS